MKKLLLHISSPASIPLMSEIARYFILQGESVVFISDIQSTAFSKYSRIFEGRLLFFDDIVSENLETKTATHKAKVFRYKKIKNQKLKAFLINHSDKYMVAINILSSLNPNLIIVAEDGISSNFWLLSAAKKRNIPILDCPYGFGSVKDLENSLKTKKQHNDLIKLEGEFAKIIKKKYSHWIKKGNFSGSLMFPPEYILALEKVGVTMPNPWAVHGGLADKIAVESEKMYRHYVNEGIFTKKLTLVGTPYCDIMYRIMKSNSELYTAYKSSREIQLGYRKILVCWPPNYDDEKGDKIEFADYRVMALSILNFLSTLHNVKVIISPHPAVSENMVEFLRGNGFEVDVTHVLELIPRCDIYFTCFSSTIRYAIACGKVVVNYNMYKFDLDDFCNEAAVFTMNSFSEMKETIQMLLDDNNYRQYAKLQHDTAAQWGILDGRNFERLETLMVEMKHKSKKLFSFLY